MSKACTFAELAIGQRFLFAPETHPARLPEPSHGICLKTGPHTFQRQWADDTWTVGTVGVGDNPVLALEDGEEPAF